MRAKSASSMSSIKKILFLCLIIFTQSFTSAYAFDESIYADVGDTFTVHTTYKSGAYAIFWHFDSSFLEPVTYIGSNTTSVTFCVKKAPSLGRTSIQATTDYMTSGHIDSHTDFWTVYIENNEPIPVKSISLSKTSDLIVLQGESKISVLWLEASVYPSNATNQKLIWSSSNEDVLKVETNDVYPNIVGYYAKKCGTTRVSCVAADGGGAKAVCDVTIVDGELHWVMAKTIEGVEVIFKVEDATTGTCEVSEIDRSTTGKITIPAVIDGVHTWKTDEMGVERLRVVRIGDNAFYGSSISSITVPDGVSSIGMMAFQQCKNLASVTISNSVESIGRQAFMDCWNLTDISLPNKLKSIEDMTFDGCKSLRNVLIPSSVRTIGRNAFSRCSLTNISIPDGVVTIDDRAFEQIELTSIVIPQSVTSIGEYAFNSFVFTPALKEVYSLIEDPFEVYDNTFPFNLSNAVLFVPVGTIEKYRATPGWSKFARIEEIYPSSVESHNSIINSTIIDSSVFSLAGQRLAAPKKGINIVGGRKVIIK